MSIAIDDTPPFDWVDGTSLGKTLLKSRHICEAMQAIKNRVYAVYIIQINNWSAYDRSGNVIADLGQLPDDNDLSAHHAWRHSNHIMDLRSALEYICGTYADEAGVQYTISTLLTAATGSPTYKHTQSQMRSLGYFDPDDLGEILKCVDLLTTINGYIAPANQDTYVDEASPNSNFDLSGVLKIARTATPYIEKRILLRFDVDPAIQALYTQANIAMHLDAVPIPPSPETDQITGGTQELWTPFNESLVTWATMPGSGGDSTSLSWNTSQIGGYALSITTSNPYKICKPNGISLQVGRTSESWFSDEITEFPVCIWLHN